MYAALCVAAIVALCWHVLARTLDPGPQWLCSIATVAVFGRSDAGMEDMAEDSPIASMNGKEEDTSEHCLDSAAMERRRLRRYGYAVA